MRLFASDIPASYNEATLGNPKIRRHIGSWKCRL